MEDQDLLPDVAAEVRLLRAEVAALRQHMHALHPPGARRGYPGLRRVVSDLETNPRTQYKVHLWGAIYWIANIPLVVALFFLAPGLWLKLGVFITLVYSIYANFATDYGGMSAAMASFDQAQLPEIPAEPPHATASPEGTDG